MNPRHALRDLRWWYRTTFKQWHEGPEYADCPDCGGQVYHHQGRTDLACITYECRDCSWTRYGSSDFEFYQEQAGKPAAWDAFKTYVSVAREYGPDDADAVDEWIENDGHEQFYEALADRFDSEYSEGDLRAIVDDLERVDADG